MFLQDEERDGDGVLTHRPTVERITAGTEGAMLGERDAVFSVAILHKGANFAFGVTGKGDSHGAIAKTRNGFCAAQGWIPEGWEVTMT